MIRGFLLLCPAGAGMLLAVQPGQLRLGGAQGCTASHRPRSALSARGSVPLRALLPHPVPCEAVRPPPPRTWPSPCVLPHPHSQRCSSQPRAPRPPWTPCSRPTRGCSTTQVRSPGPPTGGAAGDRGWAAGRPALPATSSRFLTAPTGPTVRGGAPRVPGGAFSDTFQPCPPHWPGLGGGRRGWPEVPGSRGRGGSGDFH